MEHKIEVSVIVPMYNSSKYVETLCSMFKQQVFKDFEIVFVDDGSSDNTLNILKSLFKSESDLIVSIVSQENKGVSSARNTGIDNAKGKYLCFVDSDDVISEDYLSNLYSAITSSECNVALSYITRNKQDIKVSEHINQEYFMLDKNDMLEDFLFRGIKYSLCAGMYLKSELNKLDLRFLEGYRYSEDVHLLWRLFARQDKVAILPQKNYYYYDNPDSAMNRNIDLTRLEAVELIKKLESYLAQYAPEFSIKFKEFAVLRHYWSILWQFAVCSNSYSEFKNNSTELLKSINLKGLYKYPDKRISMTTRLFIINKWVYYVLIRKYKK